MTSRFIGRPASLCRRCGGAEHWVNTMGGIVCLACSPPPLATTGVVAGGAGDVERLVCVNRKWDTPEGAYFLTGVVNSVCGASGDPVGDLVDRQFPSFTDEQLNAIRSPPQPLIAPPAASPPPRPAIRIYDWTTDEAAVDLAALAFTPFAGHVGWNEPITGCRALMQAAKGR